MLSSLCAAGLVQEAGGDRRRDVSVGHPGHCGSGGVQRHEGPIHEDGGGLPLRLRHQQYQVFRGRSPGVQVLAIIKPLFNQMAQFIQLSSSPYSLERYTPSSTLNY